MRGVRHLRATAPGILLAALALVLSLPTSAWAADVTPPIGGSITVPDGVHSEASFDIAVDPGVDPESGLATWRLYQSSASLSAGACGAFGGWSATGPGDPTGVVTVNPANGSCTIYRLQVADVAGNVALFTSPSILRIDRAPPFGTIDAPAAATVLGQLTITGSAIDLHSPITRVVVTFAGPTSGTACVTTIVAGGRWSCTWLAGGIAAGTYSLAVTVYDEANLTFDGGFSANVETTELLRGFVADESRSGEDERPPSVGFEPMDPVSWTTRSRLRYWGVDWPDVAPTFRVQRRIAAARGGAFGAWATVKGDPSAGLLVGKRGTTSCFRVLADDIIGNSAVSEEQCATVPYDDRDLTWRGNWRAMRPGGTWLRTTVTSRTRGATLTLDTVTTRMSLIATRCKGCGSLRIRQGGRVLGVVSLHAKRIDRQVVLALPATVAGTPLTLEVVGNGSVEVDGVVAARIP